MNKTARLRCKSVLSKFEAQRKVEADNLFKMTHHTTKTEMGDYASKKHSPFHARRNT